MILVSQNKENIITDAEVKSAFCYVVSEEDATDDAGNPIRVNLYHFLHKFFIENDVAITSMGSVRNIDRAQYIQNEYLKTLINHQDCKVFEVPTDEHLSDPNHFNVSVPHWEDYEVIIEEQEQEQTPLQIVYGEDPNISKAGEPMTWKISKEI